MTIILLKSIDGTATIHATDNDPHHPSDYSREIGLDEVVDGKAVRDWPDGMHDVKALPPEPTT